MLGIISRGDFNRRVKEFGMDRNSKGFSSWDQFVSMLFCQMPQAKSLREICGGLKCCIGKLVHLGVGRSPSKSNLSYSNKNRPWGLYETVFYDLLRTCRRSVQWKKKKFRFKNKLYSLDATVIDLCLSLYDWAKYRVVSRNETPSGKKNILSDEIIEFTCF